MKLTDLFADWISRRQRAVFAAMCVVTGLAIYGYLYQPPPSAMAERTREKENSQDDPPRPTRIADSKDPGAPKNSSKNSSVQKPQRGEKASRPRFNTGDRDSSSQQAARAGDRVQIARSRNPHALLVFDTADAFTPGGVAALRAIAEEIESLVYVDEVMWLDTVPTLNVFGLRENILPPEDATPEQLEHAKAEVLKHPLIKGQLVSEDGETLLMTVIFDWLAAPTDYECSDGLVKLARQTAEQAGFAADISITGLVPLYIAHKVAFDRNQRWFQTLSYVLVAVVSVVLFRGFSAVFIVAIAPAIGIFWTLGLLNLIDDRSNQLTNIVLPVLLTMVGLADGVHLMVHIRGRRAEGMSSKEASLSAVRRVGPACALTSLTTAAGFASLMVAESEFVQEFGKACAMGVLVTFGAIITVIPLLCMMPFARNIHLGQKQDFVGQAMVRFTPLVDGIMRRSGAISLASIVATVIFASIAIQLRADDKMKDNQPTGSAAYQALEHCDEKLGGIETIRVEVRWPEDADHREVLTAIQRAEQVVGREPLLKHPLSILGILSSLPGDDDVTSRAGFIDLLPTSVRRSWLDMDARQARVTVRIRDLGIAKYEPVFQRLEDEFQQLQAEEFPGYDFQLAGAAVTRGRNLYKIVLDLARSLGTASLIIFAMMAVAFRSLRLGLISLVPNLFPLVVTATVLVLLGLPLEIASVCSFTVCLGIAVDDTIHFLTRYRDELGSSTDKAGAIRRSFVGVGTAMVITTLIMMVGFGTVLASDMPGHRSFAAMAVSTIGAALVGDLLFLPALLVRFGRV